jgi:hypothetical protein
MPGSPGIAIRMLDRAIETLVNDAGEHVSAVLKV